MHKNISKKTSIAQKLGYAKTCAGMAVHRTAFTLAEVLITLGIIGIVAQMTIPALMNSVQDKTYATQLKKEVSVLNSATEMVKMDNGGSLIGLWPTLLPCMIILTQRRLEIFIQAT